MLIFMNNVILFHLLHAFIPFLSPSVNSVTGGRSNAVQPLQISQTDWKNDCSREEKKIPSDELLTEEPGEEFYRTTWWVLWTDRQKDKR